MKNKVCYMGLFFKTVSPFTGYDTTLTRGRLSYTAIQWQKARQDKH